MVLAISTVIAHSGWTEVWLLGAIPLGIIGAWELWDRRRRGGGAARARDDAGEA